MYPTQWYAEQSSLHDGKLRKNPYTMVCSEMIVSANFLHNGKLNKVP